MNGARFTPTWSSTRKTVMVPITIAAVERSTDPMVRARWVRRAVAVGLARRSAPATSVPSGRTMPRCRKELPSAMCSVTDRISRCSTSSTTNPTTRMIAIRRPGPVSQSQVWLTVWVTASPASMVDEGVGVGESVAVLNTPPR
ncbi:hypothetical protein [Cellulomonas denverensis]|uniref:hypothetical protein n=1 Tax=Cellulomonas denverensis TaxID=264297 RepID=UPI0035E70DBD